MPSLNVDTNPSPMGKASEVGGVEVEKSIKPKSRIHTCLIEREKNKSPSRVKR